MASHLDLVPGSLVALLRRLGEGDLRRGAVAISPQMGVCLVHRRYHSHDGLKTCNNRKDVMNDKTDEQATRIGRGSDNIFLWVLDASRLFLNVQ